MVTDQLTEFIQTDWTNQGSLNQTLTLLCADRPANTLHVAVLICHVYVCFPIFITIAYMLMRDFDFVNDQITYLEYNISTSGLKPVPAATGQKQDSLSQGKHKIYVRVKCLIFTEPEEQKQDKH